jgi:hypothetical protein
MRPHAAVSTFAALAFATVLAGCVGGGSPGTTATSPASIPGPTSSATAATAPAPTNAEGWLLLPELEAVATVAFDDVVWTGSRFVAVGTVIDGGGVFLDSTDGRTWHQQPRSAPGGPRAHLAAGPAGVVAVSGSNADMASWASSDGLTWSVQEDGFGVPASGDTQEVTAVVAMAGGWLAVGREDPQCNHNCGLAPVKALVWRSPDGLHWQRVPDQASLVGGAMADVTRWGTGFVAVGTAGTLGAAWTSTDGLTWRRAADGPAFHALPGDDPALWTQIESVTASHGVIVAVGTDGNGGTHGPTARAWRSADGRTWSGSTGDRFVGFSSGQDATVSATATGFLATFPVQDEACPGGVQASMDGRVWRCATTASAMLGFAPAAVAESAAIQLAVGNTPIEGALDGPLGAIWWRPIP